MFIYIYFFLYFGGELSASELEHRAVCLSLIEAVNTIVVVVVVVVNCFVTLHRTTLLINSKTADNLPCGGEERYNALARMHVCEAVCVNVYVSAFAYL